MNALTLVQTSPATNPDRNIVKVTPSGAYPVGGDPLPLTAIADSQVLVQVPLNNPGQNPPPVTPYFLNYYTPGFYPVVERIVTAGITSFVVRWFISTTGIEIAAGAYNANILSGEVFLEILCPTTQQ